MLASRSYRVHIAGDSDTRSSKVHPNAQLSFKTPIKPNNGKSVGFGTVTRTNLKENATNHRPPRTGGKSNVFPMTPGLKEPPQSLHQNTLKTNNNATLKTQHQNTTKSSRLLNLTNNTPYPSRLLPVSPLGGTASPIKIPALLTTDGSILKASESTIPPSRSRHSARLPRLSDQNQAFQTPAPDGRRGFWEHSSEDISAESTSLMGDGSSLMAGAEFEGDDEVEYMPPPVEPLPFDPGFDLPDFKALGESLWKIGNIAQFNAFDYVKPTQPPFELETTGMDEMDELIPKYRLPEGGDQEDSIAALAQLSSYPMPEHASKGESSRTTPASGSRALGAGRSTTNAQSSASAASKKIRSLASHQKTTQIPTTSLTSSRATTASQRQTRSMSAAANSGTAIQPARVTRGASRPATITAVKTGSSTSAPRGRTAAVQPKSKMEKGAVTRTKTQARRNFNLEDIVPDLMQPQAWICDDPSFQLLD
ncbi:uncharacterized protein EI90DRAFT_712486 [Cantharellus anzutake]|uniref:uncharacterized protein n=1 Tax=Cantharellus anzutake TaxID=1750568 RepID=UPI0019053A3C|nr:uncharacterized protein EI90DRAFT_712486 [Cantharellus anzutake]KAF8332828.1 hypothetical protein EI90DRAFT_712486 [Cantharellus anzutake]